MITRHDRVINNKQVFKKREEVTESKKKKKAGVIKRFIFQDAERPRATTSL